MFDSLRCRLVQLAAAVLLATLTSAQAADTWQAGAARINITPDRLMWMSGYSARTAPAEGKVLDLWAKALAMQDPAGERIVLVSLDLVGIPREVSNAVRDELQSSYQLERKSVALCCSHTHCGPVVGSNLRSIYFLDDQQAGYVKDYTAALQGKIVKVVGEALSALQPAKLEWTQSKATFAVNRRTNKEAEVPDLIAAGTLKGPVDHDVPVLAVKDSAGKLVAVAFGYACHATVMSYNQWSGDYPGFAMKYLEDAHPGVTALFWAGCGADQNPLPRRKQELAEKYGRQLADAVESALKSDSLKPITGTLTAKYEEIPLALDKLPTREEIEKDRESTNKYIARRASLLLEQLNAGRPLSRTYPYPVQTWRLGPDVLWFTLGGEVVVDFSLRIKAELGPQTWIAGYTNDVMAYIPSRRVLTEGGYEGASAMIYYGLPTVWSPQVEEEIMREVKKQAK